MDARRGRVIFLWWGGPGRLTMPPVGDPIPMGIWGTLTGFCELFLKGMKLMCWGS